MKFEYVKRLKRKKPDTLAQEGSKHRARLKVVRAAAIANALSHITGAKEAKTPFTELSLIYAIIIAFWQLLVKKDFWAGRVIPGSSRKKCFRKDCPKLQDSIPPKAEYI